MTTDAYRWHEPLVSGQPLSTGCARTHRWRPMPSRTIWARGQGEELACACGRTYGDPIADTIECIVHAPALSRALQDHAWNPDLGDDAERAPCREGDVDATGYQIEEPRALEPWHDDEDIDRAVRRFLAAAPFVGWLRPALAWFEELSFVGVVAGAKLADVTIDTVDSLLVLLEQIGCVVRGEHLAIVGSARVERGLSNKELVPGGKHVPVHFYTWLPGPRLAELMQALRSAVERRERECEEGRSEAALRASEQRLGQRLGPIEAHELTAKERRLRKRYEAARLRWIARHGLAGLSFARAA